MPVNPTAIAVNWQIYVLCLLSSTLSIIEIAIAFMKKLLFLWKIYQADYP
jgi:hypothetical protein